jgi:succinoglycan biosynthesis transport protein ExoP
MTNARAEMPGSQMLLPDEQAGRFDPTVHRAGDDQQVPMLMRYMRTFWRWKHVLIGTVLVAAVIGIVTTLLMTPLYTAKATIEIAREADKVVQTGDVSRESGATDLEFYQTQYGLLRARSLSERVARELKLADDPKFFAMFGEQIDGVPKGTVVTRLTASGRDGRVRQAGKILLDNLEVSPIRLSRLVTIGFTSPSAALSAKLTNAWATNFIESNLDRKFQATSYARKFLEQRLEQLRQRLAETERQLVQYAADQQIINLPGQQGANGSTSERSIVVDNLTALNSELSVAIGERIRAESRIGKGASAGAVTEALTNTAIGSLRQKRAEIASEYARTLIQFEPQYPAALALASQIKELDRSIANEEGRVQASLNTNYRDAMARERDLQTQVEGLKSGLLSVRQRSIQYNIYQRDVDTNRQLYDALLQRYKEIGIAGGVGTNNVSVIDNAVQPQRPSQPRFLINLALALGIGLVLGVAAILLLDQIDETISDPAALPQTLNIPLLGTIPKSVGEAPIELLNDRKSSLVEAYLALQTNLGFTTGHGMPRSLSVTSTRPAEGKSTSAYAIALMLARGQRKVLLIDGDMRSPSLHRLLDVVNDKGLSNLLAGSDEIDAMILTPENVGFSAILAGPQPPNSAELLIGDRLGTLLKTLSTRFDHIVIDSPPVMGLADAPLIAGQVEGTVFVVEAHAVRSRAVRTALARLADAHAHILGALLLKFESRRGQLGYGYDYGYGYGQTKGRGRSA